MSKEEGVSGILEGLTLKLFAAPETDNGPANAARASAKEALGIPTVRVSLCPVCSRNDSIARREHDVPPLDTGQPSVAPWDYTHGGRVDPKGERVSAQVCWCDAYPIAHEANRCVGRRRLRRL